MRFFSIILLLSVIAFSGCDDSNTNSNRTGNINSNTANANTVSFEKPAPIKPETPPSAGFKSCNPSLPLVPGSQAEYLLQFASGLIADVSVVVDKGEENGKPVFIERTQIVDKSGGLYLNQLGVRKYACDNGRIVLVSDTTDTRTEKGASKMELAFRDVAVAMPDPASLARKGTTWSYAFTPISVNADSTRSQGDPQAINFEVQGEETVKVPAGEFKVVKVQRTTKSGFTTDLYAPGIGLVKRTNKDGTTWELKAFSGLKEVK